MKVSLNWLREFVELPSSVPQLIDLLTLAGIEVEGVETHGMDNPKVIVAQISESVPHPNADRLSVCQVDDGSGGARQIVCGAKNYRVGDKVPLALPGAVLGPDFTIKVGKLRGVESQGMLCSAEELGLPKGEDGLLILPADARIGAPLSELFPGDTVLDLEITPNRADLLSHAGIAREVAALTEKSFQSPKIPREVEAFGTSAVDVEVTECQLYTVLDISEVRVGPSPEWLRRKIEAVGLRPINNIVDITNYVMLELGQPLHAFDADKVEGDIQVRAARDGEEFAALDGKTYRLSPWQVVIADDHRALALGGVMGGQATGVTESTRNILLESAHFLGTNIRRTSRALGLASDSSYRFERGVDVTGVMIASQRAAELILQTAGGTVGDLGVGHGPGLPEGFDPTAALHEYDEPIFTHTVALRPERVAALLGMQIPEERIEDILSGFGLLKANHGWEIPSFRPDLTREIDLIEEIARVVGTEAVPARGKAQFAEASQVDRAYDRAMSLRHALVGLGISEARTISLLSESAAGLGFLREIESELRRVKNPMNDEQVILRPSLLPGLLQALRDNLRAGAKTIRLFEIGRVFSSRSPEEGTRLGLVVSGPVSSRSWRAGESAVADLFDFKGLLSAALGTQLTFSAEENAGLALGLRLELDSRAIGLAGQLWPKDARGLDALAPVFVAEIDLDALPMRSGARKYHEIPRFPATARDIALLAPVELAQAEIERTLLAAEEPLLAHIELFDVFADPAGIRIPSDKKSLAYSLTYRSPDRTLTADEVNAVHARLKERLTKALGVTFRE